MHGCPSWAHGLSPRWPLWGAPNEALVNMNSPIGHVPIGLWWPWWPRQRHGCFMLYASLESEARTVIRSGMGGNDFNSIARFSRFPIEFSPKRDETRCDRNVMRLGAIESSRSSRKVSAKGMKGVNVCHRKHHHQHHCQLLAPSSDPVKAHAVLLNRRHFLW